MKAYAPVPRPAPDTEESYLEIGGNKIQGFYDILEKGSQPAIENMKDLSVIALWLTWKDRESSEKVKIQTQWAVLYSEVLCRET